MADVTIESIAIEITASANNADKALQKLTQSLAALKAVTSGGLDGANKVAKGLKQIAEAANEFQSVDGDKVKNVAEALKALKSIGKIGDLSHAASQIKHLKKISEELSGIPDIDSERVKNVGKIANAISKIGKIESIPDLSGLTAQIQPLVSTAAAINSADMSTFAANMQQLAAGLQPLSSIQNRNFSSIVNALGRLPDIAKNISRMNLGTFARQMQQIATAIEPLSRQMRSLASSFSRMPEPVQQAITAMMNFNTSVRNTRNNTDSLGKALKFANFTAFYFAARKVISTLNSFITSSNEYIENLNLFTVTMGAAADEALEFANKVNSVMGIDVSQWIQNQGVFKQMTSGFGMVEEKANLVSKNLTQLGYDISSYYNISVESAMQKLQSGLAGEVKPLRELGYSVEEATIKQVALNHGITESVSNMSQAQKAQLRYIAIMEQSKNAMGDLSRTIESPSNQLRILESRIETLKRAIGDSLLPVITTALPYVTAFVQILGEFFRSVAEFMGFELPVFDYSDLVTAGNTNIADSFDEATEAANKFKGTLSSIDQLNIIGSKNETSQVGDLVNGYDLNLELPSYDFLGGLEAETSKAYNTLKKFLSDIAPIAAGIATALGALFVGDKVVTGLKALADGFKFLTQTPLGKLAATITATVAAFLGFKKIVKDITMGSTAFGKLGIAIAGVTAAVTVFLATGNPLGAVLTVIGAGVGALVGALEGLNEQDKKALNGFLFNNGGTKITEIADAFEDWASAAKKANDEIINKYSKLDEYDVKMGELRDTMTEIAGVDLRLDEITPADAAALKEPFNELCDYLKTDFAERVNLAAQSVADAFKNLNLGESLNAEMQAAYKSMQRMFDETITDTQKVVDDYLDKISQGYKLTDAEMKDFQNAFSFTFDISAQKDNSLVQLEKTLDEIDLSKIDLVNEKYGVESLERIKSAAEAYVQSAKDRYDAELQNTAEMRRQLEVMKKYGKITDEDYNSRMDLLTLSENLYAKNLEKQISTVRQKVGQMTDSISDILYQGSQEAKVNYGDWLGATFSGFDYKNLQEYAKSRVLNDSKIYAANQELSQAAAFDWNATVEIQNTYATEETAQAWAYILKDENPDLEVMIGRIQDETGQWKYVVGSQQSLIDAKVTQIMSDDKNWQILTGSKSAQIIAEVTARSVPQGPSQGILEMNTEVDWYAASGVQSEAYDWAKKAGDWIYKGLQDGLSKEKYSAYMSEIADIGAQAFCAKYGIHSPSTLFKSYGDYIMQGLTNGMDNGRSKVVSSISETAKAMENQLKGLEFSVPVYTEDDMEKLYTPYNSRHYAPYTQQPEYKGADPEAVGSAARVWNESGKPIDVNVNVQSYVELDGDQVGEATTRYQQRQMAYSNGY